MSDQNEGNSEGKSNRYPVPAKGHIDKTVKSRKVEQDSSVDVVVSDKKIKVVLQLPINNKKENVKVVANDDYSITISHLNYEGELCTRTLRHSV